MSEPDHRQIYERVGVLEAKQDALQDEVTEFKDESRKYRAKNGESMDEIVGWVREQQMQRRILKKAIKGFAWFLGVIATGIAIFKGVR